MTTPSRLDLIGDVHGELPALAALGRELGYRVDGAWTHPDGRLPLFLGDLVDRGAHSLEVAELVQTLVARRRAFCSMGNHEYNLVAWYAQVPGYERPKRSNRPTTEDVHGRPGRWAPVMTFFRDLPLGLVLPDLRVVHACWHVPSLARIEQVLRRPARDQRARRTRSPGSTLTSSPGRPSTRAAPRTGRGSSLACPATRGTRTSTRHTRT